MVVFIVLLLRCTGTTGTTGAGPMDPALFLNVTNASWENFRIVGVIIAWWYFFIRKPANSYADIGDEIN